MNKVHHKKGFLSRNAPYSNTYSIEGRMTALYRTSSWDCLRMFCWHLMRKQLNHFKEGPEEKKY